MIRYKYADLHDLNGILPIALDIMCNVTNASISMNADVFYFFLIFY